VSYGDRARRKAQLLREMLRDIKAGRYKPSRGTVVAILFALFYFLFPLDVIFDFMPFFGYIDDLTVISFVLGRIKGEIERYEKMRGS
jgi:uncharacterized membrane protein YkvA (DUF1232 family)